MIKYGTICYLTSGGRTLMIDKFIRENDPNSGMIVAPGGRVEIREDIYWSVFREVQEESGLEVIAPELRGTVLYDNRGRTFSNFSAKNDFLVYVFSAKNYKGSLIESSLEGVPRWIENNEMTNINSRECDKRMWSLVSGEKKFFVVFKHNGDIFDADNSRVVLF